MQEKIYWIWLSRLIETVQLETLHKLLRTYKTPKNIWELSKNKLQKNKINANEIDEILNIKYRQNLENYLFYMNKEKICIITYNDSNYPKKLKNIYTPPVVLYAKGNLDILNENSIGIVGCRNCSEYGRRIATDFSYELSKNNIVVVSGLARGIDTNAHIGTIKAKGKTITVLGSGLDIVYPPENKGLYNKIIETGGTVITEYIVGINPEPKHFPARNRIISGLSNGILVVEAKERSGSLITVDFALEQGKEVYAIPGDIIKSNSKGTNKLIKEGAKLITNAKEIIEDIFY